MNTNNPDILFFVRREYGAPSIELRAYKVEKVNNEFAFLELERLRLVVFSGDFQSVSLHHEYGKNSRRSWLIPAKLGVRDAISSMI